MKLGISQCKPESDNEVGDESIQTEERQCTLGLVNVNGSDNEVGYLSM